MSSTRSMKCWIPRLDDQRSSVAFLPERAQQREQSPTETPPPADTTPPDAVDAPAEEVGTPSLPATTNGLE
jgi:hypothetical protein